MAVSFLQSSDLFPSKWRDMKPSDKPRETFCPICHQTINITENRLDGRVFYEPNNNDRGCRGVHPFHKPCLRSWTDLQRLQDQRRQYLSFSLERFHAYDRASISWKERVVTALKKTMPYAIPVALVAIGFGLFAFLRKN